MAIGIDFGKSNIKLVELTKNLSGKWELVNFAVVENPGVYLSEDSNEKEVEQATEVLKKLFKSVKVSQKKVTISIPESKSYLRTIKFPWLTDQEISSAVNWEADQYIPIASDDAIKYFEIIERREKATPPEVLVLLIATSTKYVKTLILPYDNLGFEVEAVENELIPYSRSLNNPANTFLMVDIGALNTKIGITRNGNVVFTRTIATAGDVFSKAIAQKYNMTFQKAEEYKIAYGLSKTLGDGKIREILIPNIDTVVDEIKKAVHFYESEEKMEGPKTMYLSGGSSNMIDLIPYLTTSISDMEIIVSNPLANVAISKERYSQITPYLPLLPIATGLAMR